jgi:hypothetical protein
MEIADIVKLLGTLLTILVLLRARKRNRQVMERTDDPRGYDPIEPESGKAIEDTVQVAESAGKVHAIIVALALFGAVGYLFFTESLTRWIIVGTAVLLVLIVLVRDRLQRKEDPIFKRTTEFDFDDWEG